MNQKFTKQDTLCVDIYLNDGVSKEKQIVNYIKLVYNSD